MNDQKLPLVAADTAALPIHILRPAGLSGWLASIDPAQAAFVTGAGFAAAAQELVLLPGAAGVAGAVLGLGTSVGPNGFGGLADRLPSGAWQMMPGEYSDGDAVLGFCLGAYRYRGFKAAKKPGAQLVAPAGTEAAQSQARAIYMVRDLINTPANLLGPSELGDAAVALARRHGAVWSRLEGEKLTAGYPTVAAVGAGSDRPPVVVAFRWRGSRAGDSAPLISLCGKGVIFDSGGYDLKPSSGMLRMKKDMGGAATVLGIARAMMEADLPIRLAVRIGCVENSVSGHAMRPLDVIRTRRGLSVEIGNTDAEGRLVLCDLLAEASDEAPDLLIDCATLTGAARVALGPELPALFCNDEAWAETLLRAGTATSDPMWRLPLWDGYDSWLDSPIADLNNVSSKPMAGAVTAALYLRRFVAPGTAWAHFDLYAWNDATRPGRPEGGEAMALRAICAAVQARLEETAAAAS